jgi:hypothetical protein
MIAEQQIIDALKARIIAGATDAESRVYSDRLWPLTESKLPAIRLYVHEEKVTPQVVHFPALQDHDLTIGAQLCAEAVAGIDAVINALKLQVLDCLFDTIEHATLNLGGNLDMTQAGTGPLQPVESNDRQLAQRPLLLNVRYRTFSNAPEVIV